ALERASACSLRDMDFHSSFNAVIAARPFARTSSASASYALTPRKAFSWRPPGFAPRLPPVAFFVLAFAAALGADDVALAVRPLFAFVAPVISSIAAAIALRRSTADSWAATPRPMMWSCRARMASFAVSIGFIPGLQENWGRQLRSGSYMQFGRTPSPASATEARTHLRRPRCAFRRVRARPRAFARF